MKILFISLGCDKNLVDSEKMLALLNRKGFLITDDETEADVIVINTCCFINDAKEESIQSILEMAEKYPDIAGIGVTSFGETFVCVDETGEPLHPAMLYTDPRGKEECRELVEKLGER